ncbi:TetR/AcrR family transcriptional regulator [Actinacidiphila sp. ITFR-21]|uniref:TetR/AcrR family transcriptional regulator n=1 Tax=Actinacidiphila sp. ITFR-21 TaxID=3075199 RepID=UPI00288BF25C|nr:helix-turn-helix domain-containing protein [Streptomyces sp. ITFR-21]WNI16199.1 helix-turn-helix domain-containing protein [Streptomyces sp. ITFR-21]
MTAPRQRPRKDQLRNREALITAAREVFTRHGIDGPLDVIARRAGVGNATLYRHFPTRRDLISAILVVNLRRSEAVLAEAMDRASGGDGVRSFLEWLFAEQIDNPAYMSALRAIPSGQNAEVDRLRGKTLADLELLVERAKAEGSIRADRWIEDLLLALALNEQLAHSGFGDPASASRRFLDLTLASLTASPPPAPPSPPTPRSVLELRRTLGHALAGLPYREGPAE